MPSSSGVYHFQGTLLSEDTTTYLTFPFDVPASCQAIKLDLLYAPKRVGPYGNLISLTLFDPQGNYRGSALRGAPHHEIVVTTSSASPGFIAGPLAAGRWQAELAVHLILPSTPPCTYTLMVETSLVPVAAAASPVASTSAPAKKKHGAGWYRGELHAHTIHSDGQMTVAELKALARERRLDFMAISDHNTISQWADVAALQGEEPLVIPSMELTTFMGHAVVLGIKHWVDWRTMRPNWTINDAARAAHAAGGLFIIAHPNSEGSPACTGCRWDYLDMDMGLVDGLEVWSGCWADESPSNPLSLPLWREQIAAGRAITAVGAADVHGADSWRAGVPITYVYAEDLTVQALMEGIKRGRVMVSSGPWLELRQTTMRGTIGDDRLRGTPLQTNLLAIWKNAPPGARLRQMSGVTQLSEIAVGEWGREGLLAASGRVHLELWSADNLLLAMTNPIEVTE